MTQRELTQEVVEPDVAADTVARRSTQEVVEPDYVAAVVQRRLTGLVVEADIAQPPPNLGLWGTG